MLSGRVLQIRGSEVTAVHADNGIELGRVDRHARRLLVRDLRDECPDHGADDGARRNARRSRDRSERGACDRTACSATSFVQRVALDARIARKL